MLKYLVIILLSIGFTNVKAQEVSFSDNDDFRKVYNGDKVIIRTDTAFVISKNRAIFINQKIAELDSINRHFNKLADNHNELLAEINDIQSHVEDLTNNLDKDGSMISSRFSSIIKELDQSLNTLKENNESLKRNNAELQSQTNRLKRIVKDLKKETRGLWWNGVADKIIAFTGGILIGALLVSVL